MTSKEAATILKEFNVWRRGEPPYDETGCKYPYSPTEIGMAIDHAVNALISLE